MDKWWNKWNSLISEDGYSEDIGSRIKISKKGFYGHKETVASILNLELQKRIM